LGGYEPHFDIDFKRGQIGEKLVGTFLEALSGSKIEVKTDYRVLETGNVYVEIYQQNLNGEWKASGINITEADWFVFAGPSGKGFLAIDRGELMKLVVPAPRANQPIKSTKTNASRGALVKLSEINETIFRTQEEG
jgi:hypothetical protein